jgi:hypothetical protein
MLLDGANFSCLASLANRVRPDPEEGENRAAWRLEDFVAKTVVSA